jgi:SAM-dependent methyltransferase
VARALRALSSNYVERREKLAEGAALATAGKRAAFALFYGPLHFLIVSHIVRTLPRATEGVSRLIDVGCGTGASGAAWATAGDARPRVIGIDRNAWALGEAAATYRAFGVLATTRRANVDQFASAASSGAVLAAFTINELSDAARETLLPALLERASRGDRVLIVEPIAGGVARWWNRWRQEFERAGGRADEWRVRTELPAIVVKLDRAAGLDHRELTARSLWIG